MVTAQDKEWLKEKHPHLVVDSETISGVIEFTASYVDRSGRFLILDENSTDGVEGSCLTGRFEIQVKERIDKQLSKLPALRIEGLETIPERHFSQSDNTACLCSPLQEDYFLQPEFRFKPFVEELVIPFLYGQLFYSANRRWPWAELAHGATGLLESYFRIADPSKARECIEKLIQDKRTWLLIKLALLQKSYIKGHTPCFCGKGNPIRRCHRDALNGAQRLREDIRMQGIVIPEN